MEKPPDLLFTLIFIVSKRDETLFCDGAAIHFWRIGPVNFLSKMHKTRPMKEEMDRKMFISRRRRHFLFRDSIIKVLFPNCTLTWRVNNYVLPPRKRSIKNSLRYSTGHSPEFWVLCLDWTNFFWTHNCGHNPELFRDHPGTPTCKTSDWGSSPELSSPWNGILRPPVPSVDSERDEALHRDTIQFLFKNKNVKDNAKWIFFYLLKHWGRTEHKKSEKLKQDPKILLAWVFVKKNCKRYLRWNCSGWSCLHKKEEG